MTSHLNLDMLDQLVHANHNSHDPSGNNGFHTNPTMPAMHHQNVPRTFAQPMHSGFTNAGSPAINGFQNVVQGTQPNDFMADFDMTAFNSNMYSCNQNVGYTFDGAMPSDSFNAPITTFANTANMAFADGQGNINHFPANGYSVPQMPMGSYPIAPPGFNNTNMNYGLLQGSGNWMETQPLGSHFQHSDPMAMNPLIGQPVYGSSPMQMAQPANAFQHTQRWAQPQNGFRPSVQGAQPSIQSIQPPVQGTQPPAQSIQPPTQGIKQPKKRQTMTKDKKNKGPQPRSTKAGEKAKDVIDLTGGASKAINPNIAPGIPVESTKRAVSGDEESRRVSTGSTGASSGEQTSNKPMSEVVPSGSVSDGKRSSLQVAADATESTSLVPGSKQRQPKSPKSPAKPQSHKTKADAATIRERINQRKYATETFTLTQIGKTRWKHAGEWHKSYLCSDGRKRLLTDERLASALKRTTDAGGSAIIAKIPNSDCPPPTQQTAPQNPSGTEAGGHSGTKETHKRKAPPANASSGQPKKKPKVTNVTTSKPVIPIQLPRPTTSPSATAYAGQQGPLSADVPFSTYAPGHNSLLALPQPFLPSSQPISQPDIPAEQLSHSPAPAQSLQTQTAEVSSGDSDSWEYLFGPEPAVNDTATLDEEAVNANYNKLKHFSQSSSAPDAENDDSGYDIGIMADAPLALPNVTEEATVNPSQLLISGGESSPCLQSDWEKELERDMITAFEESESKAPEVAATSKIPSSSHTSVGEDTTVKRVLFLKEAMEIEDAARLAADSVDKSCEGQAVEHDSSSQLANNGDGMSQDGGDGPGVDIESEESEEE